jgi:hypothetical protein
MAANEMSNGNCVIFEKSPNVIHQVRSRSRNRVTAPAPPKMVRLHTTRLIRRTQIKSSIDMISENTVAYRMRAAVFKVIFYIK